MQIKMTKKMLDDYRKTKREIPFLKLELREMQIDGNGLGNSVINDYRTGFPMPQSVVGFDWELYERRKKALKEKESRVAAVEQWISSIEDGQVRYVFKMFYMEGMSWIAIAKKIGYKGNPDYPRLVIRDKYLKKCGIR